MPRISDIMSRDVQVVEPQQSLRVAARRMRDLDVGALPVCDGERLLGMLTDRDLAVRAVADGLVPDAACVSDVMSPQVQYCTADQDTESVMQLMGDRQLRRLPVLDGDQRLVGIVSLGDLACRQSADVNPTLREISAPSGSTV